MTEWVACEPCAYSELFARSSAEVRTCGNPICVALTAAEARVAELEQQVKDQLNDFIEQNFNLRVQYEALLARRTVSVTQVTKVTE